MRTFRIDIDRSALGAADLIERLLDRPNDFCPQHIAGFHEPGGRKARRMQLGGEYVVEIPGPWNGPVRVDSLDRRSFTLITLSGHMEAGHIRFSARDESGRLTFEIRSWARAGDSLFEHLHLDVGIANEAQTAMWLHVCDRAAAISGGTRRGPIVIATAELMGSDPDPN